MDIESIKAFLSLAHTLNFTKSAELMFISQSSFSRQINKLEEELGVALFLRNKREVELTPCGVSFMKDAEKILIQYQLSLDHISQTLTGEIGFVRIGFILDEPTEYLSEIVQSFKKMFPLIKVILSEHTHASIIDALYDGAIDFAFAFSVGITILPDIEYIELYKYPLCAVLHRSHLLAHETAIDLKQLAKDPFIMIQTDSSHIELEQNIIQLCLEAGFYPNITSYVKLAPNSLLLVDCNMGVAMLPSSAAHQAPRNVRFVHLTNKNRVLTTILAWKKQNINPCLAAFIKVTTQLCETADQCLL